MSAARSVTAEELLEERRPWRFTFPTAELEGCESALLLFCSGRLGAYDGIWIWEAGLKDVTGVDFDDTTLGLMAAIYPGWTFYLEDAWGFAHTADRRWDVVVADPPVDKAPIAATSARLWGSLAEKVLILGGGAQDAPLLGEDDGLKVVDRVCRTDYARVLGDDAPATEHEGGWFWTVCR